MAGSAALAWGASDGGAAAALKRLRRDSLDALSAVQGHKRGRRGGGAGEGTLQPQHVQPDSARAMEGASTPELMRLGVELRGKVESHFLSELVQLRGCLRAAEAQLANTVQGESCVLCQTGYANAHERAVAVNNIYLTGDLLRRREKHVHEVLGAFKADGAKSTSGCGVGAGNTGSDSMMSSSSTSSAIEHDGSSEARLDSPGSAADKMRCGYVRYFRSLRAAGMRFRVCAVCAKNLNEDRMSKFLAGVDRLSYLAEQRFFDHAF